MKCPRCDGHGSIEDLPPRLSRRQAQVLKLLAEGLTHAEVAQRLYLGLNSVYTHTKRIRRYFGVHTTPEAVAKAQAWEVI